MPRPFSPDDNAVMLLFSGGLDSTTLLAKLQDEGKTVVPIVFNTHTPDFELRRSVSITRTLKHFDCLNECIVADMPSFDAFRYSNDPFGFQPGRKMIYISIALSYMQMLNIDELYAGYGKENAVMGFFDEEAWAQKEICELHHKIYGLETNNTSYNASKAIPKVICPFRDLMKEEVINIAYNLGENTVKALAYTSSCNNLVSGGLSHCGTCIPCLRKKQAFSQSLVEVDPTSYADKVDYREFMHLLPDA